MTRTSRSVHFDGSINFFREDLAFNLNSDLDYVNLKNIGLTNEEFTLKGLLSLDFKGNDIDQFLGQRGSTMPP